MVLHGKSNFLSGNSRSTDFDHECYTRANVAYSRATDLTVSACPVNMNGITGVSQVISALLRGACTLHTNDTEPVGVFVEGSFSSSRGKVSESTAAFLDAMEPQPLWIGPIPVCLVEYHQAQSRRLRLALTSQDLLTKGEKLLLDEQHPVHSSGLVFGYAADRCTEPDWLVFPDGSQKNAWRLLHATSKGGDRFCVGSSSRYTPGQADDAANKAKEYQFESLRKIYFYDAWRWKIELNQPDSLLPLPPRPGLLQNGCYWRPRPTGQVYTTEPHNRQASGTLAEVSLTDTSSEGSGRDTSPSEVPVPEGRCQETTSPTSPIAVGSSDEVDNCSQDNDTEPSEEDPQVATITSMSEGDDNLDGAPTEILENRAATNAARATRQNVQSEGERAEETESGTTDEVIDIEVCGETTAAQAPVTAAGAGERHTSSPAGNEPHSPSRQTTTTPQLPAEASTDMAKTGTKRPASMASLQDEDAHPAPQVNSTALNRDGPSGEGGYPSGRPSASSAVSGTDNSFTGDVKRRNRWTQGLLVGSTAPPQGVDPASTPSNGPSSPSNHETPVLLRHLFDRESHNQGCKDLSNPKQPNRPRNNGRVSLSKDCCMRFKPNY